MTFGYLGERLCRRRLTLAGLDAVETPIVALGLGGAVAMSVLPRLRWGRVDHRRMAADTPMGAAG
jgi:hypothetical protein